MFSADDSEYYSDFYTQYDMGMKPTTSASTQPRLSLDSGIGLANDSFFSTDLSESQLMDISAATASDASFGIQSGPLESSPPTKWARVRTPPNRKKLLNVAKKDEQSPEFGLFTPPNRKRVRSIFASPTNSMKTPESLRKSIRISSPSPFKVTFSKTPLKLSNNENVTGFHIGKNGAYYNKKVNGSASKRCLLQARPDGFTILGSPNSDVLNYPLETAFDGFDLFSLETPEKSNTEMDTNDHSMDYHQYAGMIERGYNTIPSVPKRPNLENVRDEPTPIVRSASRNLLKESFAIVTHHPLSAVGSSIASQSVDPHLKDAPKKVLQAHANKQSVKEEILREAKEKEMSPWRTTPFVTPKKKVPLYSGRWLVISTGRTMAQQELFSDAKRFFRTHRPTHAAPKPSAPARRLPTIARVTLFKHQYQSFRA